MVIVNRNEEVATLIDAVVYTKAGFSTEINTHSHTGGLAVYATKHSTVISLAKQTQQCTQPIHVQKGANAYIAPHHIIPLIEVPECLAPDTIDGIYVTQIRKCDNRQVVSRDIIMRRPATDDGQQGQE